MAARNSSNEIRFTRVYDAPVSAVWAAWTDLEQVAKWWGPRGFTITTHSKDLRVGGHWRYTMHGPDGVDYPNVTTYFEVEPCKRLVYDHGASDDRPALFRVTVTFAEANGRTTMDMVFALATPEAAAATAKFIKQAGGYATWDRLAEHLEVTATGRERFVIQRDIDAPVARVVEQWSRPEHTEVETSVRLAYIERRAPGAAAWPSALRTTVQFAEESPDRTRVTLTSEPYGEVSAAEVEAFVRGRPGMTLAWTATIDALEERLEAAS